MKFFSEPRMDYFYAQITIGVEAHLGEQHQKCQQVYALASQLSPIEDIHYYKLPFRTYKITLLQTGTDLALLITLRRPVKESHTFALYYCHVVISVVSDPDPSPPRAFSRSKNETKQKVRAAHRCTWFGASFGSPLSSALTPVLAATLLTGVGGLFWISLCNLCVLCVSVVVVSHIPITTETQRTQRLHREEIELGHYPISFS